MKKIYIILIIALCAAMSFAAARQTVFAKGGDETILIPADQVIDDNFMNAGGIIDIKGKVTGDVIVAGGQINIEGIVEGDVIAAGGQVTVKGTIDGDVRVAGGSVMIDGSVKKNVNAFGGNVTIGKDANIGGGLLFGAGMISIDGKIEKDIWGGAGAVAINGQIGRRATIYNQDSDSSISIGDNASIPGGIAYLSDKDIQLSPKANIGPVTRMTPKAIKKDNANGFGIAFALIIKLFSMWVLGLVVVYFFKQNFAPLEQTLKEKKFAALGWGFVIMILGPLACLLLLVTIIGAQLAVILFGLWLLALALSKIIIGILIGKMIFAKRMAKNKTDDLRLPMIVGVGLVAIITSIPILGLFIKFIIMLFGLGLIWIFVTKNGCGCNCCCQGKPKK